MALTVAEQVAAAIHRGQRPLIAFRRESLDATAAAFALYLALQRLGKVVDAAADAYQPLGYDFLPDLPVASELEQLQQFIITVNLQDNELEQFSYDREGDNLRIYLTPRGGGLRPADVTAATGEFRYDLIVCVGCPDLASLGRLYRQHREFFQRTPIINLDHRADNEHFGQINAVDLTAAAAAEVVADLLPALAAPPAGSSPWDKMLATTLLFGLIAGTGGFRSGQVTAKTLRLASDLIAAGADRAGITRALYQSHSIPTLKLWGKTLTRLKSELDGALVWATVLETDFLETEATLDELPGLTGALLAALPAAEVAVMLAQEGATILVRLTSLRHWSALELSRPFAAAGDRQVATWEFQNRSLPDAEREVIAAVRHNLLELRGGAAG